jgi:hypothetical protein
VNTLDNVIYWKKRVELTCTTLEDAERCHLMALTINQGGQSIQETVERVRVVEPRSPHEIFIPTRKTGLTTDDLTQILVNVLAMRYESAADGAHPNAHIGDTGVNVIVHGHDLSEHVSIETKTSATTFKIVQELADGNIVQAINATAIYPGMSREMDLQPPSGKCFSAPRAS